MALEINALRNGGGFPPLFSSRKMRGSTFNISSYGFISCETEAPPGRQCSQCSQGIPSAGEYLIWLLGSVTKIITLHTFSWDGSMSITRKAKNPPHVFISFSKPFSPADFMGQSKGLHTLLWSCVFTLALRRRVGGNPLQSLHLCCVFRTAWGDSWVRAGKLQIESQIISDYLVTVRAIYHQSLYLT